MYCCIVVLIQYRNTSLKHYIIKTFPLHIAWRYLFSKKGHNAINIVSGISAAAVTVVTAAMICVLSVMNGFGALVERMFSEFDAPLLIVPAEGQTLRTDTMPILSLYAREDIEHRAYRFHHHRWFLLRMGRCVRARCTRSRSGFTNRHGCPFYRGTASVRPRTQGTD